MPDAIRPILVIGSLNMDLVARCERLPAKGQTIFGQDFFTAAGGKGANQAVAAARLGGRVAMAGCVGVDAFGGTLTAGLREAGIGTETIVPVDRPTGTALITIDAEGANTIVVISGANAACDLALVDRALASASGPGVLLLQNEIPLEATAHAIRVAHASGWFVILNPAPAGPLATELLSLIDIIAPNETEAAAITGLVVSSREGALTAASELVTRGARGVLITLGSEGALYCDRSRTLALSRCCRSGDRHHRRGRRLYRRSGCRAGRRTRVARKPGLRSRCRRTVGDAAWRAAIARFARRTGGLHRAPRHPDAEISAGGRVPACAGMTMVTRG